MAFSWGEGLGPIKKIIHKKNWFSSILPKVGLTYYNSIRNKSINYIQVLIEVQWITYYDKLYKLKRFISSEDDF